MNRYQPPSHHPAFAVAALALTALTIALTVVVPANMAPGARMSAITAAAPSATEVMISPACIDTVGVREASVASGEGRVTPASQGQSS